MAALPASRLQTHLPPFAHVGIDYFGPIEVVQLRRKVKRYGVIFTCLNSRAVHLELASSLDTESFLLAFWRFAHRRGFPSDCYSDNGTNLVAGEKELRQCLQQWNQDVIASRLSKKGIEWHFNPPSAPHFGGVWERLVSSAKSALSIILRERAVSEEVLTSALVEVESLLNGRPLTHVSVDPDDPEPITPNHFLIGRANPGVAPLGDKQAQEWIHPAKRWAIARDIATHFWNRWLSEYIPDRIEKRKWLVPRRNLAVGDVVIVVEANQPKGTWPLGRITEVRPGKDGIVRSARVNYKGGNLVKPVVKLCLLETDIAD